MNTNQAREAAVQYIEQAWASSGAAVADTAAARSVAVADRRDLLRQYGCEDGLRVARALLAECVARSERGAS